MARFDITRGAGLASVTSHLGAIKYLTILAGWKHVSGAWLCIGTTPGFPDHYSVHWRANEVWKSGVLEYVDAFEHGNPTLAWARALSSAETAWDAGPSEAVAAQAEKSADNFKTSLSAAGTRGGRKSGETRSQMAEDRREAEEIGRKYGIHYIPGYDTRKWLFAPMRDTRGNAVLNFAHKKFPTTFAYLGPNKTMTAWEIGRAWHPGMNDDNAAIEEVCFENIGETVAKDDPAFVTLEKLLKSDPAKWLRADYDRFAP